MSMTPDQRSRAQVHPALDYDCPFCRARAGQNCHAMRGSRGEVSPHRRRIRAWWAACDAENGHEPASTSLQALCCECGNMRTVSSNFSFSRADANHSSDAQLDDPRGWRCTGTLNCDRCGQPTRHALLRERNGHEDYLEDLQRFILGSDEFQEGYRPDRDRLRPRYMEQFPRNPYLHHLFWQDEAQQAWNAGRRTTPALCGATMDLRREPTSGTFAVTGYRAPEEVRDQDYEDPETGLWWVEMDCVDCLRVANQDRLARRRDRLRLRLAALAVETDSLDAAAVDELLEATSFFDTRNRTA